jgi:hypothetical protein
MTQETVTITKARFEQLCEAEEWLGYLESAGIDNSSAYEYAQELREEARNAEEQ